MESTREPKKSSQLPLIPISTKRPELELLDPLSPTSLKAAKPPSGENRVRAKILC